MTRGAPTSLRWVYALAVALFMAGTAVQAQPGWNTLTDGAIVLFRHANAPGIGDPDHFQPDDCSTQRNLDEAGRQQARQIGAQFRARNIAVAKVLTSQWCRTRETAQLAFPGLVADAPAFNSFFADGSRSAAQSAQALQLLTRWRGPGVLVVVSHQVNISALTNVGTSSAEGVIVRPIGDRLQVLGRLQP